MTSNLAPALYSIQQAKEKFEVISAETSGLIYQVEAMFAMQQLQKNDYMWNVANSAPASVRNAVINVAAIGLSLNPATSYAYLVPRDKQICLDISYQGLLKIATDTGSIRWGKAELVYKNDKFIYKGVGQPPEHEADVFGDRGEFVGVYCIAKTSDGEYLVETIKADDIYQIRDKSEAYKTFKAGKARQCPWVDFFGEMTKKTCIKRASKTWPKSQRGDRLQEAIKILNDGGEGLELDVVETKTPEQIEKEQYDALCDMYIDSINAIKDGIRENNLSSAVEAWAELSEETQQALWKAPTKGGIFTTKERDVMKGNNWSTEMLVYCGERKDGE